MMLADRGMKRSEFRKILDSELIMRQISTNGFVGIAGILDIKATTGEWWVSSSLGDALIAAPGYKWLQLAPDHGKWWLTVMYDQNNELVQYYFDIIKCRYFADSGELRFVDMFLDVVMTPDGRYEILDRGELENAFKSGIISEFEYRRALTILYEVVGKIHNKEADLRKLCASVIHEIQSKSRGQDD